MLALSLLPWLITAVSYVLAPQFGRRLPARAAATMLTAFAFIAALATGLTLAAFAVLVMAGQPRIAVLAGVSSTVLRADNPLPTRLGLLSAAVVTGLLAAALRYAGLSIRRLTTAVRTCRTLGPDAGDLVILDGEQLIAYALPGFTGSHGLVVVSRAMLKALQPDERRALLAHETAHLRHHHFVYVQLANLAAAANPLLRPAAHAVGVAVERWADEVAAEHTGDRRTVARTLAISGLAASAQARAGNAPMPQAALAVACTEVEQRITALIAPGARWAKLSAAVLAAMTLACAASGLAITAGVHAFFEAAQAAYAVRGH